MSRRLSTLFDTSSANEMTKSLSQLCNQVSFANIKVPRVDSFKDIFDFISEFESATSGLEDSQKVSIINRSFPAGCNRPWFETELEPLIKMGTNWSMIRKAIIRRFSTKEERDRHVFKLRELSYDPDGNQSLLDFVEEMIFSLKKALKNEDPAVWISMVKASIPEKMRSTINLYPEFRDADTLEKLKQAAKHYDQTKATNPTIGPSREATRELASMFKEMVKSIQKDNEETRKAVVAAFQSFERTDQERSFRPYRPTTPNRDTFRPASPRGGYRDPRGESSSNMAGEFYKYPNSRTREHPYQDRGMSPQRSNQYSSSNRPQSPGQRGMSPNGKESSRFRPVAGRPPTPGSHINDSQARRDQNEASDTERYYSQFKRPPNPCEQCQGAHWNRHCPYYLN